MKKRSRDGDVSRRVQSRVSCREAFYVGSSAENTFHVALGTPYLIDQEKIKFSIFLLPGKPGGTDN